MTPPQNPAGEFLEEPEQTMARRTELVAQIARASGNLQAAVRGLSDEQLEARFRNWTIRQIVHHLADSHVHCYARFKWALTENHPTIKPYDETCCAELEDSRTGDINPPLALFDALQIRWVQLMKSMQDSQFQRTFYHPESRKTVNLNSAVSYYAWHGNHHIAQIHWVRRLLGLPMGE